MKTHQTDGVLAQLLKNTIERNDGYITTVLIFDRCATNLRTLSKMKRIDKFSLLPFYKKKQTIMERRRKFISRHKIAGNKIFGEEKSVITAVYKW